MKLSDYKQSAARHILLYGPPKSGKTTAYGKLAARFDLHIIDLEDSVKALLNPKTTPPALLSRMNLIRLPDKQTYPIGIETVLKIFKPGLNKICYEHGKVLCPACAKVQDAKWSELDLGALKTDKDVVVLDSWSQLVESSMNYIMRKEIAAENFDAKPGWDEYGKQGRILERIGSMIQTAPFNIVVVSHEMMVEMEDKSKRIVPIGGTTNASKVFGKYFDDVVYCSVVNSKHKFVSSTTGMAGVLAGSRAGIDLTAEDSLLALFN